MNDYEVPDCHCLNCNKNLNGALCYEGDQSPGEGDLTMCFYCGEVMVFDNQIKLRALSDEDFENMPENLLLKIQSAREVINRAKGEK